MRSFLLLLLFFIFALVLVALIKLSRIHLSLRTKQLAFGFYMLLLFLTLPAFYAVAEPVETATLPPYLQLGNNDDFWDEYNRLTNEYMDALLDGRVHTYEGARLNKKWHFSYPGERLLLTADSSDYDDYTIILKRKDTNTGTVDVYAYAADFGQYQYIPANPPEISLQGNRLEIKGPPRLQLSSIQFLADFTSAQFTGEARFGAGFNFIFFDWQNTLYLEVPEGLEIETDKTTDHSLILADEAN